MLHSHPLQCRYAPAPLVALSSLVAGPDRCAGESGRGAEQAPCAPNASVGWLHNRASLRPCRPTHALLLPMPVHPAGPTCSGRGQASMPSGGQGQTRPCCRGGCWAWRRRRRRRPAPAGESRGSVVWQGFRDDEALAGCLSCAPQLLSCHWLHVFEPKPYTSPCHLSLQPRAGGAAAPDAHCSAHAAPRLSAPLLASRAGDCEVRHGGRCMDLQRRRVAGRGSAAPASPSTRAPALPRLLLPAAQQPLPPAASTLTGAWWTHCCTTICATAWTRPPRMPRRRRAYRQRPLLQLQTAGMRQRRRRRRSACGVRLRSRPCASAPLCTAPAPSR